MDQYLLILLLRLFSIQGGGVTRPASHFRTTEVREAAIAEYKGANEK